MLNPLNLLKKFIKSSNQKELDRIQKIVRKVNELEKEISVLSESDFPRKTNAFIENIKNENMFNHEIKLKELDILFKKIEDDN